MKRLFWTIICLLIITSIAPAAKAEWELNHKYMTLVNGQGKIICRTAHQVTIGDRYLDSSNHLYEVYQINKEKAMVKLVREKKSKGLFSQTRSVVTSIWNARFFQAQVKEKGPVAIYHTHDDESYDPSDGTSSKKANGGIVDVGDSLSKAFEEEGLPTVHSKASHYPHDAMAYDRSRRTATQLLKQRPSVLLDVHRDAVPREEYATEIDGKGVTKVQLVVGRENPNFEATNNFAKQIKQVCDKKYPGFIKGIFYGKGKYNQDISPRAMLLEFGTNTNNKNSAIRGTRIFAAAAKDALFGTAGMGTANRGGWRSLFWIIAAAVGGVALFLLMNRGGLKNISKEFTGAIGEEGNLNSDQSSDPNQFHKNEPGEPGESS